MPSSHKQVILKQTVLNLFNFSSYSRCIAGITFKPNKIPKKERKSPEIRINWILYTVGYLLIRQPCNWQGALAPNISPLLISPLGCKVQDREVLLKGKAQYSWPPCTTLFRSAPFYIENIISYLNEVNCTEPSPSVSVPCSRLLSWPPTPTYFRIHWLTDVYI
jgi:hypothetical protein